MKQIELFSDEDPRNDPHLVYEMTDEDTWKEIEVANEAEELAENDDLQIWYEIMDTREIGEELSQDLVDRFGIDVLYCWKYNEDFRRQLYFRIGSLFEQYKGASE